VPGLAVMTGTGLGEIADHMEIGVRLDYKDIPHFPRSTVQTHSGHLQAGTLGGHSIWVLQGRFHLYEGYTPLTVTFPVRVLRSRGVNILVLTNASGGLNPAFSAGGLMIIKDHINLTGANPLIGPNEDDWGPRFPDMTAAYTSDLRDLAQSCAQELGIDLQQGVYAGLKGPSLETPAEMRYLQTIGADAVGFSTVMETIAAVHAGMRVLGLSIITNMNLPDNLQPSSVAEIIDCARATTPLVARLIGKVLTAVAESGDERGA